MLIRRPGGLAQRQDPGRWPGGEQQDMPPHPWAAQSEQRSGREQPPGASLRSSFTPTVGVPAVAQGLKGSGGVTAVAQVQSLARELPYAVGAALKIQ